MSAPDELGYALVELADLTGLSPRTIHYYSSQGLLPPADRRGAGARYPVSTLDRLRAVQAFKSEVRLTLQEIRRVLGALSEEWVAAIASGQTSPWEALDRPGKPAVVRPPDSGTAPSGQAARPAGAAPPGASAPPSGAALHGASGPPSGTILPEASASSAGRSTRPQSVVPGTPLYGGTPGQGAPAADSPTASTAPSPFQPGAVQTPRDAAVIGGEASAQLASLLRTLDAKSGRSVPRAGSRDHWLSIPITADLQISAHRVNGEDIEILRRVADHLRALLVQGFADTRPGAPEGGGAEAGFAHGPRGSSGRSPGSRLDSPSGRPGTRAGDAAGRSGAAGQGDGAGGQVT